MKSERTGALLSAADIAKRFEGSGPASKKCECGVLIDLSGMEGFAHLVDSCDDCSERINRELSMKRERERENSRRRALKAKAEERWQTSVPKLYRATEKKHPEYPKGLHSVAMKWVMGTAEDEPARKWLGIIGLSGKCKTRVMSQVVKSQIFNGVDCRWVNATKFQWCAQHQHDNQHGVKAQKMIEQFKSCEFLAFDDLGKQKWTDTVESYFWDLIEERYAEMKMMIWTSNSSLESLEIMLTEDRAKAIIGRLAEFSNIIEI